MLKRHSVYYSLLTLLLLTIWVPARAQQLQMLGIGMSGRADALDTLVRPGDSLFFIVQFLADSTLDPLGVVSTDDEFEEVRFQYYTDTIPSGNPISTGFIGVDSTQVEFTSEGLFDFARFAVRLPTPLNLSINSMQIVFGLYARTEDDIIIQSVIRSSFLAVGEALPLNFAVDSLHDEYIQITHSLPDMPQFSYPANSDTIGRYLEIVYSQPISADSGQLTLLISEFDSPEPENFLLYLSDESEGDDKIINLDMLDLISSPDVDSTEGDNSLSDGERYSFKLSYRYDEGVFSDTGFVTNVYLDAHTEGLQLIEPDIGSESPFPSVYVVYNLQETADTVWLIFEADTLTPVPDIFSPHQLALIPQYNPAGLQSAALDGTDIGTNSPLIIESNRGVFDSLIAGTIYNVILRYGDRFGNDAVADTNYGYVWPEDLATIPASIQNPRLFSADNSSVRVDFTLPEAPMVGTVRIFMQALPSQPGSPHTLWLGGLGSSGSTGLYLNGTFLSASDMVTQVDGGNVLVDGAQYLIRVDYQDSRGNATAVSPVSIFVYDNHTGAPTIDYPLNGDTLSILSSYLIYDQPEIAIPGTVKLTFTQTGGPEVDTGSPHTLYMSSESADTSKTLIFNPAFLIPGDGVDSVHSSGSLLQRAKYRMTFQYQDTLGNPAASVYVDNLLYPSGSRVSVHGASQTVDVIPNQADVPVFYLGVTADGQSALRGLKFRNEGNILQTDLVSSQSKLWASADSFFSPTSDNVVDIMDAWTSGDFVFDSFGVGLSEEETFFIVTLTFSANANTTREATLTLPNSGFVDCGNDAVDGIFPIGGADVPLPVTFSSFFVNQDSVFGSLRIAWLVESEWNNAGFNLFRRLESDSEFQLAGSYTEFGELYGRGTEATSYLYQFIDRGLTPGLTYVYQVESVSLDGGTTDIYHETASGTPRIPPNNFELRGSYPNPFNQSATIEYVVPFVADITITIYDILGRQVRELVRAQQAAAVYRATWDGRDDEGGMVPSGVYVYRMTGGKFFTTANKMLLVR